MSGCRDRPSINCRATANRPISSVECLERGVVQLKLHEGAGGTLASGYKTVKAQDVRKQPAAQCADRLNAQTTMPPPG